MQMLIQSNRIGRIDHVLAACREVELGLYCFIILYTYLFAYVH